MYYVTFCVKSCYILPRKLLHFASKDVTFCVNVTFALVVTLCGVTPHIYQISYFSGTGEEPERSRENVIKIHY